MPEHLQHCLLDGALPHVLEEEMVRDDRQVTKLSPRKTSRWIRRAVFTLRSLFSRVGRRRRRMLLLLVFDVVSGKNLISVIKEVIPCPAVIPYESRRLAGY